MDIPTIEYKIDILELTNILFYENNIVFVLNINILLYLL